VAGQGEGFDFGVSFWGKGRLPDDKLTKKNIHFFLKNKNGEISDTLPKMKLNSSPPKKPMAWDKRIRLPSLGFAIFFQPGFLAKPAGRNSHCHLRGSRGAMFVRDTGGAFF